MLDMCVSGFAISSITAFTVCARMSSWPTLLFFNSFTVVMTSCSLVCELNDRKTSNFHHLGVKCTF